MEDVPDPEVGERASRRTYTARYELEVLAEYERLDKAGEGALLRRKGLYTSLITAWRARRDKGALAALEATSRGPKPVDPAAMAGSLTCRTARRRVTLAPCRGPDAER